MKSLRKGAQVLTELVPIVIAVALLSLASCSDDEAPLAPQAESNETATDVDAVDDTAADSALVLAGRLSQKLYITWVGVIDNGEGDDWPHGPYGSLHVLVYRDGVPCGDIGSLPPSTTHTYLPGPSRGEWLDGDAKTFSLPIYTWRPGERYVQVIVYESDPGPFRDHDELFCMVIDRLGTNSRVITKGDLSKNPAHPDAIRNCLKRMRQGGAKWISRVHPKRLRTSNTPQMYLSFSTK